MVYCTGEDMNPGKNGTYYASFKISASGDDLYLTDKDGEPLDESSPALKKAYEAFCRHNGSFSFEDFYRIAGYNDRADGLANEFIRRQRDVDVKAP